MRIAHKTWACLVSEETLVGLRAEARASTYGEIRKAVWRQIEVHASADSLSLRLMDVDEQAALGGYWSGGFGVRDVKFTWDDLNDKQFVAGLFFHEQVCVMNAAMVVIDHLREHMASLRQALVV